MKTAILDVDGTLVDTNYQHAIAWFRAFSSAQIVVPVWRVHRHIGMGGDQLVRAVAGDEVERACGDAVRADERERFAEMIAEVKPMAGAHELVADLGARGHKTVLASSARREEVEYYLDLLELRERADAWTSADDVEASKPAPDIVESALARAGCGVQDAVMVGDSPWDARAAARAGVPTIAVMTGGFSREELLETGAAAVYESVAELRERLDETALR